MQHEQILKFFAQFIQKEVGIIYAEHNYYQLLSRLEDVARMMGHKSVEELFEVANRGIAGPLRQKLLDMSTNNETSFFRDVRLFEALKSTILNQVFELAGRSPLQIWSAASSTGQEPVSVCILIKEWAKSQNVNVQLRIAATDISERVLERAKSAKYTNLEIQRGILPEILKGYFRKTEDNFWQPNPDILSCIHYSQQNLKRPFHFDNQFQLIMCRNVLIYQNVESKIEIISRMTKLLVDGGFLILGSGESLLGLSSDYDQVPVGGVVVYRKKQAFSKAG